MKSRALLSMTLLAGLVAGCATSSKPPVQQAPVAPPPPPVAAPAPPPPISLSAEQRRLADLFRGTPVVFELTAEGNMRVEVPADYCFDKGRAVVKPPLAKVLDYVATSAKAPGMKTRVTAPTKGATGSTVQERANSARDYLVSKGVPVNHFAAVGPGRSDAIEIVVSKL